MALKKRIKISFRWRLFIAVLLLVWSVIAVFVFYQYRAEQNLRRELMRKELGIIDSRILFNYEQHRDVVEFVKFIENYLTNSVYDEVNLSVYENDSLISHIGDILPLDGSTYRVANEYDTPDDSRQALVKVQDRSKLFYFTQRSSTNGNLTVLTAMPYTFNVASAMAVGNKLWVIVAIVTLLATLIVLFATRMISANIILLRNFAAKASRGEPIGDISALPHDEIGEISREIFKIYEERLKAMEKSDREHRIALHAVEEKSRIKRQLTNNINHELKTPIGVIRGYLDTIHDNPDMDDDTRNHFLERTRQNVERLCGLLNDVSTITRLEDGSENIPVSAINMHDLVYTIANDVEATHIIEPMKFTFDIPLYCEVQGNQGLLSGMIMNLIKNASVHSHGTEAGLRLISESRKYYVFAFFDNGTGVDEEQLPHLFERFFRVDTGRSRKVGGTGLGLPIVKNTVISLGGAISVHNRSTGGLEFIFSLKKKIDN